MNCWEALTHPVGQKLTMTLLHFFWQGAAIAGGLSVLLHLCRNRSAHSRYALATTALFMMAVCPVVTATFLWGTATETESSALREMTSSGLTTADSRFSPSSTLR